MITVGEISTERKPLDVPLTESANDPAMVGSFTNAGSIVIRIGLGGSCSMQILAKSSAEEDLLGERLVAARPLLDLLRSMFTGDPVTGQVMR